MNRSILIIGAGPGIGKAVASRFGKEGFTVSLVSRSADKLEAMQQQLKEDGIEVLFAPADVASESQLSQAVGSLIEQSGGFDVVLYNAAVLRGKDILEESPGLMADEFRVNVGAALQVLQLTLPGLKERTGSFLFTGGGLALQPMSSYGSLSIGKAGLRSLALQLNQRLKREKVYAGILTVAGFVKPESATHSPSILADLFWKMNEERNAAEIQH